MPEGMPVPKGALVPEEHLCLRECLCYLRQKECLCLSTCVRGLTSEWNVFVAILYGISLYKLYCW